MDHPRVLMYRNLRSRAFDGEGNVCSRKSREGLRRASVGNLIEDEPHRLAQWDPKRSNMQ
jgi:hypothetical protein